MVKETGTWENSLMCLFLYLYVHVIILSLETTVAI